MDKQIAPEELEYIQAILEHAGLRLKEPIESRLTSREEYEAIKELLEAMYLRLGE